MSPFSSNWTRQADGVGQGLGAGEAPLRVQAGGLLQHLIDVAGHVHAHHEPPNAQRPAGLRPPGVALFVTERSELEGHTKG